MFNSVQHQQIDTYLLPVIPRILVYFIFLNNSFNYSSTFFPPPDFLNYTHYSHWNILIIPIPINYSYYSELLYLFSIILVIPIHFNYSNYFDYS